jgi:hypothetical protein
MVAGGVVVHHMANASVRLVSGRRARQLVDARVTVASALTVSVPDAEPAPPVAVAVAALGTVVAVEDDVWLRTSRGRTRRLRA